MRKITGIGTVACAMLFASGAQAAMPADHAGEFMVRARAVHIGWQNSTNTTALAGVGAANKTIPEVDLNYFFTPNIAAELVLTYPQKVTVDPNVGSLKALPPSLTLQYHFMPDSASFRPYIGAGINYTRFSSYSLGGGTLTGSSNSTGFAMQAGFDMPITDTMTFNVDVKKEYIKTDISATATGASAGTLKLDPVLLGVGLGWKF